MICQTRETVAGAVLWAGRTIKPYDLTNRARPKTPEPIVEFDLSQPITDYSGYTSDELTGLHTAALSAMDAYRTKPRGEFTAADLDDLARLRSIVDGASAERSNRPDPASLIAGAPSVETTPEPAPTPEPEPAPEAVTAAAPAATAPRISQVAQGTDPTDGAPKGFTSPTGGTDPETFSRLVRLNDSTGAPAYDTWGSVAKAAERQFSNYSGAPGTGRSPLVVVRREFEDELRTDYDTDAIKVLEYAGKESRLAGGSLTAAAGWCAPSTTLYDLCELETRDGLVDVPEVQVSRGGIRFTPGPDFAAIFGGSGYFHYTESQVIAGVTKPCMVIPCPDFQDIRLEVDGLCITGSLLQRRGYPELVERFIRGALVAHAHKLNAYKIAQMVLGSTAVDLTPVSGGGFIDADTTTSGLLAALEWQIVDLRYRFRMGLQQTMELVGPAWALPMIRADFSRRTGVELTNVTDAMIQAHFTNRGARVQWVYDWQDQFSAGVANTPGGASPSTGYPAAVSFLMYPAGTWVAGVEDVIRLDTVYDSTGLAANQYTALFSEEGILMAKPCGESRVVEFQFCPTGTTAAAAAYACQA